MSIFPPYLSIFCHFGFSLPNSILIALYCFFFFSPLLFTRNPLLFVFKPVIYHLIYFILCHASSISFLIISLLLFLPFPPFIFCLDQFHIFHPVHLFSLSFCGSVPSSKNISFILCNIQILPICTRHAIYLLPSSLRPSVYSHSPGLGGGTVHGEDRPVV